MSSSTDAEDTTISSIQTLTREWEKGESNRPVPADLTRACDELRKHMYEAMRPFDMNMITDDEQRRKAALYNSARQALEGAGADYVNSFTTCTEMLEDASGMGTQNNFEDMLLFKANIMLGMLSGVASLPEIVADTLAKIKNTTKDDLLLRVFQDNTKVPKAFLDKDLLTALCHQECMGKSMLQQGSANFLPDDKQLEKLEEYLR
ncbi:MAG: hypothetical protein Q9212_004920 [Teloschistes hypoglaucus]